MGPFPHRGPLDTVFLRTWGRGCTGAARPHVAADRGGTVASGRHLQSEQLVNLERAASHQQPTYFSALEAGGWKLTALFGVNANLIVFSAAGLFCGRRRPAYRPGVGFDATVRQPGHCLQAGPLSAIRMGLGRDVLGLEGGAAPAGGDAYPATRRAAGTAGGARREPRRRPRKRDDRSTIRLVRAVRREARHRGSSDANCSCRGSSYPARWLAGDFRP